VVSRRAAIVIALGLLAGAGALLLAGAGHVGDEREPEVTSEAARTPAPVASFSPAPAPVPTPGPGHSGLRIEVSALGIDLPVVEGDGYNAPLFEAAHYPGTSWPGEGGRSVIYAHARARMFGPLAAAGVGEHIEITGRSGVVERYVITQYFPRWPVTNLSWLRPGDHEQIVLITCTTYNYEDPRIIVVGDPG